MAAKIFVFVIHEIFNQVFREISLEFRETGNQNLGNILAILQERDDFLI